MQCLTDEVLGDVGPVGVRGVDEVDAELDGSPQDSFGLRPAPWYCPSGRCYHHHQTTDLGVAGAPVLLGSVQLVVEVAAPDRS